MALTSCSNSHNSNTNQITLENLTSPIRTQKPFVLDERAAQNYSHSTVSKRLNMHPQISCKSNSTGYLDPILGASTVYQQRAQEISALQFETVKWERSKKFRRKKDYIA